MDPGAVSGHAVLVLPVAAGNVQGRREDDVGLPDGRCRRAGDRYHINVGARVIHTELTVDQNAASNPNPTFWGTDSWNGVLKDFDDA